MVQSVKSHPKKQTPMACYGFMSLVTGESPSLQGIMPVMKQNGINQLMVNWWFGGPGALDSWDLLSNVIVEDWSGWM